MEKLFDLFTFYLSSDFFSLFLTLELPFIKLVWVKLLADIEREYWVIGFISIAFYYYVCYCFYNGLKNDLDVFLAFKDLYISKFGGGKNCLTIS